MTRGEIEFAYAQIDVACSPGASARERLDGRVALDALKAHALTLVQADPNPNRHEREFWQTAFAYHQNLLSQRALRLPMTLYGERVQADNHTEDIDCRIRGLACARADADLAELRKRFGS